MHWTLILLLVFGTVLVLLAITWLMICRVQHGRRLYPGDKYTLDGRVYQVPPTLRIIGAAYLLNETPMRNIRTLTLKTAQLCADQGIEIWATYGTLLGMIRHGTVPIPWDDDVDFDTDVQNREFLYSPAFGAAASAVGLEAFKLAGSSAQTATKEGSAIRLRLQGTKSPTLDIFFNRTEGGQVRMIESWFQDSETLSQSKAFPTDLVFPLQTQTIDGFTLRLPAKPQEYLKRLYSDDVLTVAKPRPLEFSHVTPFLVLDAVWVKL
jgi:hypothetical protein